MDYSYSDFDSEWSFCSEQLKELHKNIIDKNGKDFVEAMCGNCQQYLGEYENKSNLNALYDLVFQELFGDHALAINETNSRRNRKRLRGSENH